MKKIFALFLVLLFIFSLAACTVNVNGSGEKEDDKTEDVSESKSDKKDKDKKDTEKAEETKTETGKDSETSAGKEDETEPAESEQPAKSESAPAAPRQVIVHMGTASGDYYAEDGKLIFSFFCLDPEVSVSGGDGAADRINEVLKEYTDYFIDGDSELDGISGVESMRQSAEEFYKEAGEYFYSEFVQERRIDVPRIDGKVLSMYYNDYFYIGGAHGGTAHYCMNFDVETGELLTMDEVFSDGCRDFFRECIIEYCEKVYHDALYDSYKEYVDDIIDDGFWYFNSEGITFFADEYVLAPYAAGMLEFPIPYSSLAPYINEKYLPAEVDVNASVSAKEPKLGPRGSRDAIDYVAVYFEGEEFCFLPQDTVTNVKLYATTYYAGEETISVFNDYVLWACSEMNKKQALDIVNMFPDVVSNIGISCTLADGTEFSKLLYQSGEDGSILFGEYR